MSLELYRTATEFRSAADQARASGRRLALVPTMGALHAGHRALMREAARRSDIVAVTIFVNPTQFGPNEDFDHYPRNLEGDLAVCRDEGVTLVFAPSVREMYPTGECTRVRVKSLAEHLCGASRPGHFDGVTTIVTKLFAVAGPCIAVFGRKDYQQLKVIERMTRDLLLPVHIVGHSTVRESDGLALSSRNAYLSSDERRQALAIPRALSQAVRRFSAAERRASALLGEVDEALANAGLRVDYTSLSDPEELRPLAPDERVSQRALLAVAAFVGATRLIDNVVLGEDPAPIQESH